MLKLFEVFLTTWSDRRTKGLVTNNGEGGLQNGKEGHVKFTPTKRGGKKGLSHAEGGAQQVLR